MTEMTIKFNDRIVAVYRPHPMVNPWHCYSTRTGCFIEARTDEEMARFGPYHQIPMSAHDARVPLRHTG